MRGRGASSCPRHCSARGPGTGSAAGSEGRTRRWRPAESHREGSSPPAPPGPGPSAKGSPARLRPAPGRGSRGAGPGEGSGCQSAASLRSENATNDEILLSLKYVRPGNGYEPNFTMFEKCDVNGENAHPLFKFLKEALPFPHDDPVALMTNPQYIIWSPVCRNDISWNFEKFLIGPDGIPFKRYSRRFETIKIQDDIEKLLQQIPSNALN